MKTSLVIAVALLAGVSAGNDAVHAQDGAATAEGTKRTAELTRDVERVEAVRAVKRLQYALAHYMQVGLWEEIAALFGGDAEIIEGDAIVRGKEAIAQHYRQKFGGGDGGLAPGAVHTQFALTPAVILAEDGCTARARWSELAMTGAYGKSAAWAGGIQVNDYVKENGVWKISRIHYYPQFAGPYESGWRNVSDDLPIAPYRFTPDEIGKPVIGSGAPSSPEKDASPVEISAQLTAEEQRIRVMNDEDQIRNLQNAYGYYVDRKMWDDVVDLFTADGVLEISTIGTYRGPVSIRRALERDGPQGLRHGELNDQLQLDPVITLEPGGQAARARGLQLSMVGRNWAEAYWAVAIFENEYVKQDGTWRIAAMRIFPMMKTDYYQGWAKSAIVDPIPETSFAPDVPAPPKHRQPGSVVPAFSFLHPVTGKAVEGRFNTKVARVPKASPRGQGKKVDPLSPADLLARLNDAELRLRQAAAYDAVENLSSALGYWLDDFQWEQMSQLFSRNGRRLAPAVGYYVGPERIRHMQVTRYGPLRQPRRSIAMHRRTQPVIHVAADARSARLRTRLFQFNSRFDGPGSLTGGIYEDRAVLEDGVWKFSDVTIWHIWRAPGYERGWARVEQDAGKRLAPRPDRLIREFPPDEPLTGDVFAPFPAIGKMWFHYRNPVSGRAPEHLLPD